jgi:hypothetical protein
MCEQVQQLLIFFKSYLPRALQALKADILSEKAGVKYLVSDITSQPIHY